MRAATRPTEDEDARAVMEKVRPAEGDRDAGPCFGRIPHRVRRRCFSAAASWP